MEKEMKNAKRFVAIAFGMILVFGQTQATSAATGVSLGSANNYAVLASSTITNTGSTMVKGDVGLSPGTSVTGFPPGMVSGTLNVANADASEAKTDLTNAFTNAFGQTPISTISAELGGTTKNAGIYKSDSGAFSVTGTLTLDGQGDTNSVFIINADSTLITATGSRIVLINEAQPCNVFWVAGSSATLGTNSIFVGNVLASSSITLNTGAKVTGRVLAINGAVSFDSNDVTTTFCSDPATTPTPTSTLTPTPTQIPANTITPTEPPTVTTRPRILTNTDGGSSLSGIGMPMLLATLIISAIFVMVAKKTKVAKTGLDSTSSARKE